APYTFTCATPGTIEMRCAMNVSAYSSSCDSGIRSDVNEKKMIGESAGFTFWYDGGMMPCGRSLSVLAIIAWTSCAAPSIERSSVDCIVIDIQPRPDDDVMLSMPAIVENCFSSGVATADAIVSGLAPGRLAFTVIVGKSTVGKSLTGRRRYAVIPKNRMPAITRTVVTGRRINSSEKFISPSPLSPPTQPALRS